VGGADETGPVSATLRYDPRGFAWQALAPKPAPVRDVSAAAVQGTLIVPGGCDASGTAVPIVAEYDIRSDAWSAGQPWPAPTCGYALALLDGVVFVFGGRTGPEGSSVTDAAWAYDPREREWVALERMPAARSDLAAVVVSDEIHLLGGRDARAEAVPDHWVFRPYGAEPRWDTTGGPRLPEARAGLAAATALGRIYVIGGGWSDGLPALVWDRRADDWARDPTLLPDLVPGPTPWRGAALAVLDDRFLVLAGGTAERGALDGVRLFEVARPIYVPR
jgi:hypothetical protein